MGYSVHTLGLLGGDMNVKNAAVFLFSQGTGWNGDIAIDPFDSNTCIHTTGQGVWVSHDCAGADPTHWTFADRNLEQT